MIKYHKDLDIRNLSSLSKGVGCKFLIVIKGLGEEYVAKRWCRKLPKLKENEILIIFE